ncbi:MAG: putative capsular polysaccharide synthesis family protein [Lachnospiraceae bacterium]|nr:putative capsular polysaccharide synthesis family protein [Lachnospiraceae bacterium]
MIKDLQIMKDISPLFEKKLVMWGMGQKGHDILEDILSMGAGQKGILLCDSDYSLWGKDILNNTVLSPNELKGEIQKIAESDIAVLVTVASVRAQDEIISAVETMCGKSVDIYTEYAVEWGIYLGLKNPRIENKYKDRKITEHEINRSYNKELIQVREEALKYFAFLPLHQNEIILVYQSGKVASSTVCKSISNYDRYALHCHRLDGIGENDDSLYELLNLKSGKIISLVRDPVARQIAAMWQNIYQVHRYSAEVDFSEIERYFFPDQFDGGEFTWFDGQMKKVFKIDVFDYPFDKESGYSIIRKGNIELLLLKMEKINELEDVIGDFLNIEQFRLDSSNVGSEKSYRFAYRDYKANFRLPQEILENIYMKNEHMKHFYSEQERKALYEKWIRQDK